MIVAGALHLFSIVCALALVLFSQSVKSRLIGAGLILGNAVALWVIAGKVWP